MRATAFGAPRAARAVGLRRGMRERGFFRRQEPVDLLAHALADVVRAEEDALDRVLPVKGASHVAVHGAPLAEVVAPFVPLRRLDLRVRRVELEQLVVDRDRLVLEVVARQKQLVLRRNHDGRRDRLAHRIRAVVSAGGDERELRAVDDDARLSEVLPELRRLLRREPLVPEERETGVQVEDRLLIAREADHLVDLRERLVRHDVRNVERLLELPCDAERLEREVERLHRPDAVVLLGDRRVDREEERVDLPRELLGELGIEHPVRRHRRHEALPLRERQHLDQVAIEERLAPRHVEHHDTQPLQIREVRLHLLHRRLARGRTVVSVRNVAECAALVAPQRHVVVAGRRHAKIHGIGHPKARRIPPPLPIDRLARPGAFLWEIVRHLGCEIPSAPWMPPRIRVFLPLHASCSARSRPSPCLSSRAKIPSPPVPPTHT